LHASSTELEPIEGLTKFQAQNLNFWASIKEYNQDGQNIISASAKCRGLLILHVLNI
jgi:hypothetical protein